MIKFIIKNNLLKILLKNKEIKKLVKIKIEVNENIARVDSAIVDKSKVQ
jgi:hypothetical protein